MANDPKELVAGGYDEIAMRYLAWSALAPSPERMAQLRRLLELLPPGADVLELGCGAGVPVTRALAERGSVTGVDISAEQLALAERHVPDARLIHADMAELDFEAESFDAVVAFYALTHLPRDEHAALLERIAGWLRPGGLFFATMGANDSPDMVEPDWLGTPMFFSHYDAETNRDMVRRAGLELIDADVIAEEEDGETVEFLWVAARRPARK
jgi:cyclopropane fatty-acyl-phospholipid synthase-like methyltransferase